MTIKRGKKSGARKERSRSQSLEGIYAGMAESRQLVVYPFVQSLLSEQPVTTLLDFGGGDGAFLEGWMPQSVGRAYHYDQSAEMRRLAEQRLKGHSKIEVLSRATGIAKGTLDAVTMIAVWMELPTEAAAVKTLRELNLCLRRTGRLIAVVTHPCFREEQFASYKTDFSNEGYLESGRPFHAEVSDRRSAVTFSDYHWNLEDMSRQLAAAGFLIGRLYERPDIPGARKRRGSPWLVVVAVPV